MTSLEKLFIEIAATYMGQREKTGRNDGTFVNMLQAWVSNVGGKISAWYIAAPWCAMFASYVLYQAAKKNGVKPKTPRFASSSKWYKWSKANGLLAKTPHAGCVAFIIGGKTGHSHTCIVEKVDAKYFYSIDGNIGNKVCRNRRPLSAAHYSLVA
jgi:hypothetical protein